MNKTLTDRLRLARAAKKLSQVEVYEKTGINNKTLSGYENGVSEPDLETLKILARTYECSTDYLLGNTADPTVIDKITTGNKSSKIDDSSPSVPEYFELHRLIKKMPDKEIKEVLNFAKYTHLKGKDRGPDDDDDF